MILLERMTNNNTLQPDKLQSFILLASVRLIKLYNNERKFAPNL